MKIKEFVREFIGSKEPAQIEFKNVEESIGFELHRNLKEFWNSFCFNQIDGILHPSQIKLTEKWGNWFDYEGQNEEILITLLGIKVDDDISKIVHTRLSSWTGGIDFGKRIELGTIEDTRGDMILVFNNDTGEIEWIDFEYGQFGDLNKDPNGVLADSIEELLELLTRNK
ncbi:MAG: hypothetical protein A2Y22_03355 [Clostridiales bacterium GWD2_32_59]|nr:MAG: hypothetical protein A2Y22_03355 [Clostridiales bacterium GWD2_32_59]